MHVCQRCVCFLLWRPLSAALQQSTRSLHQHTQHNILQHSTTHTSVYSRAGGLRYFTHQHTASPDVQNTDPQQNEAGKHVVPLEKSAMHQTSQVYLSGLDAVVRPSPLQEISDEEAVQIQVPSVLPADSFTLRPYVEKSETLRKLVQLGVSLWDLEQRPNVGSMLVRLDFQADVAPRLLFLRDLGVEESTLGRLLTKNPFILTESLDNLQARVSYLKSKKFSAQSVAAMVSKAPYLLNFSVERLDNRLGFFQQQLGLNAEKTRNLVTRLPKLLCGSLEPVKENLKVCELEFGFRGNEIQHIVTTVPKVLLASKRKLTQIFNFVHNTMDIPHSLIAKFPQVLNAKFLRIRERHLFLEYLGRAQYQPDQPNYISLDRLVFLPDDVFCSEVALASLEDFERFQKTL
ncbi:transcription termination factor 3, mitochondrial [Danio aesculapii]|uniref:transcription termination factor 3, mitochondrial n=1 Tax=Danio aesculapii TaxID=1142201 RepID=UPI0024BFCC7C|nr:transcription termination factor 3, mitochondrial [Danio aesculapii]